jgi:hypothetical protein
MNAFVFRPGMSRISSTRTFEEYRETEASLNEAPRAVTKEGDLLDYETLELRVHPPNIRIKIEETATLITLDSANRPGTLIEVCPASSSFCCACERRFLPSHSKRAPAGCHGARSHVCLRYRWCNV